MTIDTQEVGRYVERQLKTFKMLPLRSDFNDGVIEGLNLVKTFIQVTEEREGKAIADELDEDGAPNPFEVAK